MKKKLLLLAATLSLSAIFLVRAEEKKTETTAPVTASETDAAPLTKLEKSEAEWKAVLSAAQFSVMRKKGTERPGSSELLQEHRRGVFKCAGCETALFASDAKFESGTGWPSFSKPFVAANVFTSKDDSMGMERDEVLCARCGAHLGHVFDDGPKPTGLRYCLNGVALKFEPRP